jgi:hypothetical protein
MYLNLPRRFCSSLNHHVLLVYFSCVWVIGMHEKCMNIPFDINICTIIYTLDGFVFRIYFCVFVSIHCNCYFTLYCLELISLYIIFVFLFYELYAACHTIQLSSNIKVFVHKNKVEGYIILLSKIRCSLKFVRLFLNLVVRLGSIL